MALTTNLVAYYKLDGNSNDSKGSNNGSDTSVSYSSSYGKINQGAGFNGSSSDVIMSSSWSSGIANGYSISFWCKTSDTSSNNNIFLGDDNYDTNHRNWQIALGNGTTNKGARFVRFNSSNSVITNITSSNSVNDGNWHHIVCVFDSSVGSIVYVDNVNKASDSVLTANNQDTGGKGTIGVINYSAPAGFINGLIDEVGIWNRVLSASEISELYNSGAGLTYPFITFNPAFARRRLLLRK